MAERFKYILMIMVLAFATACKTSKHSHGGELRSPSPNLSSKEKAQMPQANAQGYIDVQQLRMIEYRIMFYKDRRKEAKKMKQYDRLEIYEMNLKRYQRLRRQMTTLYVRIVRDFQSDF